MELKKKIQQNAKPYENSIVQTLTRQARLGVVDEDKASRLTCNHMCIPTQIFGYDQ